MKYGLCYSCRKPILPWNAAGKHPTGGVIVTALIEEYGRKADVVCSGDRDSASSSEQRRA